VLCRLDAEAVGSRAGESKNHPSDEIICMDTSHLPCFHPTGVPPGSRRAAAHTTVDGARVGWPWGALMAPVRLPRARPLRSLAPTSRGRSG